MKLKTRRVGFEVALVFFFFFMVTVIFNPDRLIRFHARSTSLFSVYLLIKNNIILKLRYINIVVNHNKQNIYLYLYIYTFCYFLDRSAPILSRKAPNSNNVRYRTR